MIEKILELRGLNIKQFYDGSITIRIKEQDYCTDLKTAQQIIDFAHTLEDTGYYDKCGRTLE